MDSSSSTHSALTTYGGWAVLLLVAGYVFTTYQNGNARRSSVVVPAKRARPQETQESTAPPKKKVEKAVKPKKAPKPVAATTSATTASTEPAFDAEELAAAERKADREFARQLSSTHAGHTFTSKKADEKRQKSVKQSKAEQGGNKSAAKEAAPLTVGSDVSHAEDADDDLSPQASPVIEAAPSSSNDVSDMLEASAPGPSVLRLTGTDAVKAKSQPKAKATEVVETKKQRQNRKKAEAAKAAREEDEKQRKVLLEQQRRTARIAEGRAAKDGSVFLASQQSNAWNGQNGNSNGTANVVPLLDTFEAAPSAATPAPAAMPAASSKKAKDNSWTAGVPSEEDQIEALRQEGYDSWSEVKTKKKGKQGTPATSSPMVEPAAPKAPVNGAKKPLLVSNNSSFAALTPEDTEDVDEEWDV